MVGEEQGTFGGGVNAVVLDGAGNGVNVGVEHGEQRNAVFCRDEAVGFVERMDVVGPVVGRKGNAGQNDFAAGVEQSGDDGVEITPGIGDGEAAEAIVAAEFDDDNGGMKAENVFQAHNGVFAGIAADPGVDDLVVIAALVEGSLKVLGPGMAGGDAIAGSNAVAEAVNDRNGMGRDSVCRQRKKQRGKKREAKEHARFIIEGEGEREKGEADGEGGDWVRA